MPTTTNSTTTNPTVAITEALRATPDVTAATLAEAAGIGRSTANKFLAAMEREGTACRVPGGHAGGRRAADRWSLVNVESVQAPTATEPNAADDGSAANNNSSRSADEEGAGTPAARLGKGALNSLVLDYLAANPGEHSPVAVAKALGNKSSGAVGNALARLVAAGQVRLASAKPRRYEVVEA